MCIVIYFREWAVACNIMHTRSIVPQKTFVWECDKAHDITTLCIKWITNKNWNDLETINYKNRIVVATASYLFGENWSKERMKWADVCIKTELLLKMGERAMVCGKLNRFTILNAFAGGYVWVRVRVRVCCNDFCKLYGANHVINSNNTT